MRSFVAVIDEGSLQAAARKLRSTQPTVGRHVAMLEQQLDSQLFDRSGRQLLPTALALDIAAHARRMEDSANAIGLSIRAQANKSGQKLRIAASQANACYLLPAQLANLHKQFPDIAIELVASNRGLDLLKREADIALRRTDPQDDSLVSTFLGHIEFGAYAHQDYLSRKGIPLQAEDLLKHDLIGFDNGTSIIKGFEKLGMLADKSIFVFRSDDHIAIWQAIRAGVGIGFFPNYIAWQEPEICNVLPEMPIAPLDIWLTMHRDLYANKSLAKLYNFLVVSIQEQLRQMKKENTPA